MIDPTAPDPLDESPTWSDADTADAGFARRCATYLMKQGLEPQAIVVALRTELGLTTSAALAVLGGPVVSPRRGPSPTTPMAPNVQLITL